MIRRPPRSPLFPSTALFRSRAAARRFARRCLSIPEVSLADPARWRRSACRSVYAECRGRRQADRRHRAGSAKETRSEEHTSELQSPDHLVCRLLLEKKNYRLENLNLDHLIFGALVDHTRDFGRVGQPVSALRLFTSRERTQSTIHVLILWLVSPHAV